MVTNQEIERQLKAIGAKFSWWGRAEIRELEHIIEPGENIMYCLNGYYVNGFALLCVTDQRLVLIDKKPLYLTLEDVHYDMISEVDFEGRLFDSVVSIHTLSKVMKFSSFKSSSLRQATAYLQRRILESRKQQMYMAEQVLSRGVETEQQVLPEGQVGSIEHRITNQYTKVPFTLRRRLPRFYN